MAILSNIQIMSGITDLIDANEIVDFEELESVSAQMVRIILQEWLDNCEPSPPAAQTYCRECGNIANYVSKRIGFYKSQFGLLRYRRSYYVCPSCHQSTCPLDERLDPVESLARLRAKLAAGNKLPVAEMARDWGLGSLSISTTNGVSNILNLVPASSQNRENNQRNQLIGNSGDYFPNRLRI